MSSKFLDKTGLDTLWAKIKSTFQTLGNMVTAWGSTPSDTKYPSEKLVKDSLDGKSNTGHTHSNIVTEGDNRNVSTKPNDYSNKFAFRGLKTKSAIGNPSSATYSYLLGLRGYKNETGGKAHELAFNDNGIFTRKGSTTSWEAWEKLATSKDLDADYRTKDQDISKGTNVVVNSNGTLQTNYNWPATTFIGDTDLPEGVAGCFHRVGADFFCNEFISLNTSKEFTVESWYRVKTANTSTVRLTLACFDIDKKSIQATDICYGIGTLTTVAREIKNGDTEIYLTDLSASAWDTSTYYERRLIFWDYQNSLGYTYPPETYSKHTYYKSNSNNGTWLRGSLDRENNKITLIVPWDGGTVPVGTKVSRGGGGGGYYYAATSSASGAATVWTKLSGKLKGFSNNVAGGGPFRPGTAFVKIGWVNANTASPEWFEFCGIELRENPSAFNGVLPVANGGTGKATVTSGNYLVGNGKSALTEKTPNVAANDLINALTTGESTPTDNDYYVSQFAGGGTTTKTFHRRPVKALWEYIKGKISSVLGLTATAYGGNAATATSAAGYTSGGAIDTALQGKENSITDLATIRSGASAGATAVQPGDIGTAAYKDVPASGNASKTQVVMGSDSRLSDARPASDVSAWAKATTKPTYEASEVGAMKYYSALSDISGSLTSASTIVQVVSAMADGSVLVAEVSNGTFSDNSFGPASGGFGTITIVRRSKYRAYATFVGKDDSMPRTCSVVADTSSYAWDKAPIRTTSGGANTSNIAWCIKITRLKTSGRGYARITVDLERHTNNDDFGFVDVCVKTHTSDWHAFAAANCRRTEATQFGQCRYQASNFGSVGGVLYIGVVCTSFNSHVVATITGDYADGQFSIETGDYSAVVAQNLGKALQTRFQVYANYNGSDMAAIGASTQPTYVNANGQVVASTGNVGDADQAIYMQNGVLMAGARINVKPSMYINGTLTTGYKIDVRTSAPSSYNSSTLYFF